MNKVGSSWRMDETYIKVNGQCRYLYRAVDKEGNTVDFLLTATRTKSSAKRFFKKAISNNGVPEKITIDGSEANKSAAEQVKTELNEELEIRQNNYLNNIVEQDHRGIKRIIKPMMGFKTFRTAKIVLGGIETMCMLQKKQFSGHYESRLDFYHRVIAS